MMYFKRLCLVGLLSLLSVPIVSQDTQAQAQQRMECIPSLVDTFLSLRRVCVHGVCDINRLLKDKPNFNITALYHFLTTNRQHVTFLFKTNKNTLDQNQWKESKSELSNLINATGETQKNAVFVIGSASRTGSIYDNRVLAANRMRTIVDQIKSDLTVSCDNFFYTFTGAEGFQFQYREMDKYGMISNSAEKLLKIMGWGKRDTYVNQNVMVIAVPCIPEMCEAAVLKSGKAKVCDDDPSNEHYLKECRPFVCGEANPFDRPTK